MCPARRNNLNLLRGVTIEGRADYQTWMFAAAGLSLILIAAYSLFNVVEEQIEERRIEERRVEVEARPVPNFASISDIGERKAAFFGYFRPFVDDANRAILEDRTEVLKLQQSFERNGRLSGRRLEALNALLVAYDLDPVTAVEAATFHRLLRRADTVPTALALAQAAIESGWGTSRFARQGNNLFGMWCYKPGCGIVPKRRPPGRIYEVAAYPTPADSFKAYLRNLNTNDSYADFREIRYQHRVVGAEPSAYELAAGLTRYSQERWAYVDKVQNMIRQHSLELVSN